MRNPFSNSGLLNQVLEQEHCQRILFTALRSASRNNLTPPGLLTSILDELRALEHYAGPSIYLLHPKEVDLLFRGATLAIYQTIKELYVDRLGRSLPMITRVLEVMAEQAGVPPITPEAIWAIGVYLNERRSEETAVDLAHNTSLWVLTSLHFDDCIVQGKDGDEHPTIAAVIDTSQSRLLAWRIISADHWNTARALTIYDALVLERKPAQLAPAGLSWRIPERLSVHGDIPSGLDLLCQELEIILEFTDIQHSLASTIQAAWSNHATTMFTQQQFRLTFDTYLHRLHGFGPLRAKRQYDREFAGLLGYNRDPAWQLPALRTILPVHQLTTNNQGEVKFDGLHFQDELLTLFPNTSVTLRQSEYSEATAWIYLHHEILCEAKARELRRPDGTYRSTRPSGTKRLNH